MPAQDPSNLDRIRFGDNDRQLLRNAANAIDNGLVWANTREQGSFWQIVKNRLINLSNGNSNASSYLSIPRNIIGDDCNPITNTEYIVLVIDVLDRIIIPVSDRLQDAPGFWLWLKSRLDQMLGGRAIGIAGDGLTGNRLISIDDIQGSFTIPPLRQSHKQYPPKDERTKNLGRKPAWYVK